MLDLFLRVLPIWWSRRSSECHFALSAEWSLDVFDVLLEGVLRMRSLLVLGVVMCRPLMDRAGVIATAAVEEVDIFCVVSMTSFFLIGSGDGFKCLVATACDIGVVAVGVGCDVALVSDVPEVLDDFWSVGGSDFGVPFACCARSTFPASDFCTAGMVGFVFAMRFDM